MTMLSSDTGCMRKLVKSVTLIQKNYMQHMKHGMLWLVSI